MKINVDTEIANIDELKKALELIQEAIRKKENKNNNIFQVK